MPWLALRACLSLISLRKFPKISRRLHWLNFVGRAGFVRAQNGLGGCKWGGERGLRIFGSWRFCGVLTYPCAQICYEIAVRGWGSEGWGILRRRAWCTKGVFFVFAKENWEEKRAKSSGNGVLGARKNGKARKREVGFLGRGREGYARGSRRRKRLRGLLVGRGGSWEGFGGLMEEC